MNFSLLDSIATTERAVLATILRTEGHTYKKPGAKALFVPGNPIPCYGNLGSGCADQDLMQSAERVCAEQKPGIHIIDTSDESDVELGYGAYCGGTMHILLEPILAPHRDIYGRLRRALEQRRTVYLAHDLETGRLTLGEEQPEPSPYVWIETCEPLTRLLILGATPLATRILWLVEDMELELHLIDWRPYYLRTARIPAAVRRHEEVPELVPGDYVIALSHHFERDMAILQLALASRCEFVGLLSSRKRRDEMITRLRRDGIEDEALDAISSPVGIDIGARSDSEIAVSVVAELVKRRNP